MTISCVLSGGSSVSVILEESVNWSFDPKACLSSLSDKKQRRRIVSELKCRMNFIPKLVLGTIASVIVPIHSM